MTHIWDGLTDWEKSRLKELESEIETTFCDNEDIAWKILAIKDKPDHEKLDLMSAIVPLTEAGDNGITWGMKNAYVYEETEKMEKINEELRSKFMIHYWEDESGWGGSLADDDMVSEWSA